MKYFWKLGQMTQEFVILRNYRDNRGYTSSLLKTCFENTFETIFF